MQIRNNRKVVAWSLSLMKIKSTKKLVQRIVQKVHKPKFAIESTKKKKKQNDGFSDKKKL